jgi:hypothetical protein
MWHSDAYKGHTEFSTVYGGSFGYQFDSTVSVSTIVALGYGGEFNASINQSFVCVTSTSTSNTISNFKVSTQLINTLLGQIDGNFVDIRTPLTNRSFYQIEHPAYSTYTNALNIFNPPTTPNGNVENIVIDDTGNLVKTRFNNLDEVAQEGNLSTVVIKHPDGIDPQDSATIGQVNLLLEGINTNLQSALNIRTFGIDIDGSGNPITSGLKGYSTIPYDCEILAWSIIGDTVGSIEIDIWKSNVIPTGTDSICAGNRPKLINQQFTDDDILTGWTLTIDEGDIIAFNVISSSLITKVNLVIKIKLI